MEKNKGVLVRFLGHSTFLIQSPGGKEVLIDPWVLSNPSCPDEAGKLEKLDLMLITHGHGDHMPEAVTLAGRYHPWIACNFEISHWLAGKGIKDRITGMNKVIPMHYATFPVLTGTPAKLRELVAGTGVEILDLRPGQGIRMN